MNTEFDSEDWFKHPVTREVLEGLKEREQEVLETIATSRGLQTRFLQGYLQGTRDILSTFSKEK